MNTIEPVDDVCAKTGARFMRAPVETLYKGGMRESAPGIASFLCIGMALYCLPVILFHGKNGPFSLILKGTMTGGLVLAFLAYRRSTERWSWADFGFVRPSPGDVGVGLLAAAAGTVSSIVCRMLHLMPSTGEFNQLSPEITGMALLAAACFETIGSSFAEECIFRGYLIPASEKRFGTKSAVLLSSVLFGLFHLQYAVMTFAVGIILSGAFLRRRSIWAPLIAHIANNTMMTFVGYSLLERAAR